ncbi:MAG: hypothetical protein ACP5RT_01335 [Candidatus Micrarchaeia archaeon]
MAHAYKRKRKLNFALLVSIVAVVLVIAAIVFALTNMLYNPQGIYVINSHTSLQLSPNMSVTIKILYTQNPFVIYLKNTTNNAATFYITRLPVLAYPVLVLYITPNSSANISSTGSNTADMHIYLKSSGPSGVSFEITPVDPQLGIKTSGTTSLILPIQFNKTTFNTNVALHVNQTTVSEPQSSQSSNQSLNSSKTPTTTTTTTQKNNTVLQKIASFVNTTSPGILMNNFNELYIKDQACNASVYNATFQSFEKTPAIGPNSFNNISQSVPMNINLTFSKINGLVYIVNYSANTHSKEFSTTLLSIRVNMTDSPYILNISFNGPFSGLNLTQVRSIYNFQNSIQNNCGAYIPYIPTG